MSYFFLILRSEHVFVPQSLVKLPTHKAISLSVFARLVAATTPRLAFRHSGLNDPCCDPSRSRATPTRSRRTAVRSTAITRSFLFRTEAVTTLLLAIWHSHEPDASAGATPTSTNGRYWSSILCHTMVQSSGKKQCSGKERNGCKSDLAFRFHIDLSLLRAR